MKSYLIKRYKEEYLEDLSNSILDFPVQEKSEKYILCHSCRNVKGKVVRLDVSGRQKVCDACGKKRWVNEYIKDVGDK